MSIADYRKFVVSRAAPGKVVKDGIKLNIRTNRQADIVHAVLGVTTEVGEVLQGLQGWIAGSQLRPEQVTNLGEELGDAMFYLTLGAKALKVKMPPFSKKVVMKQAPLITVLQLQATATDMLDVFKKACYGQDMNLDLLRQKWMDALRLVYALSAHFFDQPIITLVEVNRKKLSTRYPDGFVAQHAIIRNLKAEGAVLDEHVPKSKVKKSPAKAEIPSESV